jgi:hypothetical protein
LSIGIVWILFTPTRIRLGWPAARGNCDHDRLALENEWSEKDKGTLDTSYNGGGTLDHNDLVVTILGQRQIR